MRPWLSFTTRNPPLDSPPIPTDLLTLLIQVRDGCVLDIPVEGGHDIDWQESFTLNPLWVPWLDKWLRACALRAGAELEQGLNDVTEMELGSRLAGWHAREIIDTFNARWAASDAGDPDSMIVAAEQAIKKIWILTQVTAYDFNIWDNNDLGPKTPLLKRLARPWRFQGLCLLGTPYANSFYWLEEPALST